MRKATKPKRQHYLPRFYLENFADESGLLWIFDRGKSEYRPQTPRNTAVWGNYYTFRGEDGNQHMDIEELLSNIEAKTSPVLTKLDHRENVSVEEKTSLAIFISFLMARVPEFDKRFNELYEKAFGQMCLSYFHSEERIASVLKDIDLSDVPESGINTKDLLDFIQSDNYDLTVKLSREHGLVAMLRVAMMSLRYFLQMDWSFLWTPKDRCFITGDNPFLLLPPENCQPSEFRGIITPGAKKIVPLTANTCLIMGDRGTKVTMRMATRKEALMINQNIALNICQFLIARDKLLLEDLIRITGGKTAQYVT